MSDTRNTGLVVELNGRVELNREEALETILSQTDTQAIFSSTGLISRSVYENYDGPNHFYNAGGFGLTSTLALGFSAAQPLTKTVIIEGDGSVLANLGNLNLVGHYQPGNLLHIVLDNGAYSSCSGEPTFGSNKITEIAAQLGYKNSVSVSEADQIENTLIRLQEIPGPNMLRVIINTEGRRDFGRPTQMAQIARRFRNHFSS
jgi:phosphonopyruvate decarboxylase